MKKSTDAELLEKCKSGDRSAFNQLVQQNQERVYWVIRRIIHDHDDALDIAQEVFVKAYQKMHTFRGDAKIFTWLYRIAVNLSLNHVRRNKLRSFMSLSDGMADTLGGDSDPVGDVEHDEMQQLIDRAVDKLPEKQRAVFILRYFEELSYDEISSILNTSTGGLKANYHHAVRKIEAYVRSNM